MFWLYSPWEARSRRARVHKRPVVRAVLLGALVTAGLALLPVAAAQAAGPGSWTQAQVNTAVDTGVAYLAANQNPDGSFGSDDAAETGMALAAFGVEAAGNFENLSPAYQTDVKNAITYLLNIQDTTHNAPPDYFGAWASFGTYQTYSTGLALLGLSFFQTVDPGVPAAIANGRAFLTGPDFQGPANTGCGSSDGSSTAYFCGGWNYDAGYGRSDESNTGYAMTGLEVTGGIPPSIVPDEINWQHHVQVISTNPFMQPSNGGSGHNDGGAAYQPAYAAIHPNGFASNANDSGTNLFSYADNGVSMSDPNAAASLKFDQDVLDAYELMQGNVGPGGMSMIAHAGATEDGSCTPNTAGCDWYTSGDGGYHYSLFALTKGLGSYIRANLSDPSNWYAKVVDLLLSQQQANGSWPQDGRDDASTVFATGLSVAALGKVAIVPSDQLISASGQAVTATEGQSFNGQVATFTDPDTSASGSEYSATIDWGDGNTSTGTISGSGGSFSVSGSHTYTDEGSDPITVTITDVDNTSNSATATDTATVADGALTAGSITSPGSVSGQSASLTGGFTDANTTTSTTSDFTATIDWGDGNTSAGTVSGSGGSYTVTGHHTYTGTGNHTIKVHVADDGGSTVDLQKTVLIYGTATGGSFMISSTNTAVGTSVNFWGAQWAKNNPLTVPAPSAFKGFEDQPSLPGCGQGWKSDPGNSTPPPAGPLPAYMLALASSSITGAPSNVISGNTVSEIVVKTNPGYGPSPSTPGTGTVVATICP